ncbi:MAG: hypothetical protein EOO38_22975, partial [Cytophagaceae bacterium]
MQLQGTAASQPQQLNGTGVMSMGTRGQIPPGYPRQALGKPLLFRCPPTQSGTPRLSVGVGLANRLSIAYRGPDALSAYVIGLSSEMFMFVAAQRNLSLTSQPVQISDQRWGCYRDHVTAQGSTVTIACTMDTDKQKKALKVETKRGYGFFHIQTEVRATTVLLNDGATAYEGDTHKALSFGSTTVGPVRSKIFEVDPRGFVTFEGRQQPGLPHVDAQAIFFCTETAPMLTEFLMDAWDSVDSTTLSRAIFHESAALGAADGATFGLIGAGLRVG